MPYPDIKDSKLATEMTFFYFLPETLLAVTAPVWVTVFLVYGFEQLWFSLLLSLLITIAMGCLVAVLLPPSVLARIRRSIGLRPKRRPRRERNRSFMRATSGVRAGFKCPASRGQQKQALRRRARATAADFS